VEGPIEVVNGANQAFNESLRLADDTRVERVVGEGGDPPGPPPEGPFDYEDIISVVVGAL
jgi:hypothetical protein